MPELITFDVAAGRLGLPVTKVHQLVKEGSLIAIRGQDGVRRTAGEFFDGAAVVKGLSAVITLLRDGNFDDLEIMTWLFRDDDSLPGTPVAALRENRGTEVKRRAQAAGF
ncbi:MAG: DNA-binding protein [Actinobacteria bacterium]|nr:DNA-binding protein [Actinomycetota bacterium]